ncbi:MAG: hypothetical protein Q9228_008117, partial [Teloschistes exilis]
TMVNRSALKRYWTDPGLEDRFLNEYASGDMEDLVSQIRHEATQSDFEARRSFYRESRESHYQTLKALTSRKDPSLHVNADDEWKACARYMAKAADERRFLGSHGYFDSTQASKTAQENAIKEIDEQTKAAKRLYEGVRARRYGASSGSSGSPGASSSTNTN